MRLTQEYIQKVKNNSKKWKYVVAFSGGKDSLAALILAIKKYGKENITVVFCDTKWEHPLTYKYIQDVMEFLGLEIQIVSSTKYDGFMDLVMKKKRFPSVMARFCTEELKSKPMVDFILDQCQNYTIVIQGIRKDESPARSLMSAQCTFFKYYFQPYKSNEITVQNLGSKQNLTPIQQAKLDKAKKRLSEGKNDEKYHTYRKNEVIEHCKKYVCDIERPAFDMSAIEVIQIGLDAGLKQNPLYYLGVGRVGCFPCIQVNKTEMHVIITKEFWVIEKIREYEIESGHSFFPPDYVPVRYRSKTATNKKGVKVKYPTIDDVVRYILDKNAQGDMFDEEIDSDHACMSFYGICE